MRIGVWIALLVVVALCAGSSSARAQATDGLFSSSPNTVGLWADGTEYLHITSTGNVGVGTTGPQSVLDVREGTNTHVAMRAASVFGGASGTAAIEAYNDAASATVPLDIEGSTLIFNSFGGNVGIGTTAPQATLDVRGIISGGNSASTNGSTILEGYYTTGALSVWGSEYSSGAPVMGYAVYPSSSAVGSFLSATSLDIARAALNVGSSGNITFYTGTAQTVTVGSAVTMAPVMTILNDGYVGIANTSPSYVLDVTGEARFTGGYTTSDRRWKKDIVPIKDGLSIVDRLQGVTFDWRRKEFPQMHFTEGRQFGFIAQEVQKIVPEAVSTDNAGYENVSYQSFIPILAEAVKQLKADNDDLRAELKVANDSQAADGKAIAELRGEVAALKNEIHAQ